MRERPTGEYHHPGRPRRANPVETRPCAHCGEAITRRRRRFRGRPVCSPACRAQIAGAASAAKLRLGVKVKNGARMLYVGREHHLADAEGYARESRLAAETKLGRRLAPHELVVMLNGDPLDCRPENLAVRATRRVV